MGDYEFVQDLVLFRPGWMIVPEIIPDDAVGSWKDHLLKYPGIKEDVYVPFFKPDPAVREHLGLSHIDLVVTIRPPANEAHYHRPESDELFLAVIKRLSSQPDVRMVVLPRNSRQDIQVRQLWPELLFSGKMIIPEQVVDGLNLIWFSDLVVSGGGTMNREAAALGVPVYSIFRGKIGAVDHYLAEQGRLILIEKVEDISNKIKLARRDRSAQLEVDGRPALQMIVEHLIAILESKDPLRFKTQMAD